MRTVSLTVNGNPVDEEVEPRMLLSDFLRHELGLTGTHVGCEQGVCGACTVLVDGETVRSCLTLACQADGTAIQTVEGLAPDGGLNVLQRAFQENHGLQCGFCTPGFLMAATALLERNDDPSEEEIRDELSGNICRCTGYTGIVRSVQAAALQLRDGTVTASEGTAE
ncbi:MAG: aerobic carbon-monoxide dehydrogenase small subunit [Thermoleophilaceae bacterium]|jgi:carbon-monoxide dehydrogenase small subunit|nr:aerobic carbon-monoxide dehydrogenase small subunit [Thermoleophilaceae bacterium]MEA2406706.1 aerobic carbon-monoxide dehydrogenase small subunit [Thermoleophilaceae bacterium]